MKKNMLQNTVYNKLDGSSASATKEVLPSAAVVLVPTTTAPTASDINANGKSDVLFQYTGGDYQVGFWMDGKDSWQSDGIPQPRDWDILGPKDMDANGKADVVMFGNITEGVVCPGAYVGYYKDAKMDDWVTIGYLTQTPGVTWNVKVGNVTGNEGKNSIIWHSKEMGTVGAWVDGSQEWVTIGASGAFDANWEMVGVGDISGDGKDDIIFEYQEKLYSIDMDGQFAELANFGAGWDVRAIGDFSKDGKKDIILFHDQTGTVVKLNDGKMTSSTDYEMLGQLDAKDWFIVGAGDYDGDKYEDLLVRQYSTGMLGYYEQGDMSKWVEMGRGVDMNWTVIA